MCQNEYFNWLLIFEVLYTFKLESICRVVSLFTLIHLYLGQANKKTKKQTKINKIQPCMKQGWKVWKTNAR